MDMEANGIKASLIESVNISLPTASENTLGFLERLKRAIAPIRFQETQNEVRRIEMEGVMERAAYCKTLRPWISDNQAFLEAVGIPGLRESQADNVMAILSETQDLQDTRGGPEAEAARGRAPASSDFVNSSIDAIKNVSDEEMRHWWARLIDEELSAPESFSKRSISVMSQMDGRTAKLFERLCANSFVFSDVTSTRIEYLTRERPVSFAPNGVKTLVELDPSLTYEAISDLESLGLVTQQLTWSATIAAHTASMCFWVGPDAFILDNHSDTDFRFDTSIVFTTVGKEMYRLCERSTAPGLLKAIARHCDTGGVALTPLPLRQP